MGWFTRKSDGQDRRAAFLRDITDMAVCRFGALGCTVAVVPGTSGAETVLVAENGSRYPLHALMARALTAQQADLTRLVTDHVSALVDEADESTSAGASAELPAAE
jgi:hypothetical protein